MGFNPDQPRDEKGQFASTGSGGASNMGGAAGGRRALDEWRAERALARGGKGTKNETPHQGARRAVAEHRMGRGAAGVRLERAFAKITQQRSGEERARAIMRPGMPKTTLSKAAFMNGVRAARSARR